MTRSASRRALRMYSVGRRFNAKTSWGRLVAIMTTVTAKATRDGAVWLVHVPEIDRWTQARTIVEIESMARDLAAIMTNAAPDSIRVIVDVELPTSVQAHLDEVERARMTETAARTRGAEELRRAVRELREAGISVRDVGKLMGISHQRASQLSRSAATGQGRRLAVA